MTIGNDIGDRKEVFRTVSEFSGEIIVEDVSDGTQEVRRLVFMKNQNCIQSEALLKVAKKKDSSSSGEKQIDFTRLTCDHHSALVAGLALVMPLFQRGSRVHVSVVGLGGGVFPMFLHHVWECMKIDSVEIDPAIVEVARNSFQFVEDDRMTAHVADGLEYIKQHKDRFEVLILDVDSKDNSQGISCPPVIFLEEEILRQVYDNLDENGVFMINLVCRSPSLREETQKKVCSIFPQVMVMKMERDLNTIIFAFKKPIRRPTETKDLLQCLKEINKKAKRPMQPDSSIFSVLEEVVLEELTPPVQTAVPPSRPKKAAKKPNKKKK